MRANQHQLYQHVEFLTELRPYRNFRNLGSLQKVVNYLTAQFTAYGLEISFQSWEAMGNEYQNVIATYNPKKKSRLIVGAHYDVCGDQPGADDNASAIAGLLETARLIALHQPALDYRIDFVAYNLEEPPFFNTEFMGSYVHARSMHEQNIEVIGMVCYEMIGYFSDEPGSQLFPTTELAALYPDTGNFIILVGTERSQSFLNSFFAEMQHETEIDIQKILFPDGNELAGLSDHRSYWHFGFPALMINDTSFLRNPNYHEGSDTIDTLSFDKMAEVVNGSCRAIINIV